MNDFREVSKETVGYLFKCYSSFEKSPLDKKLILLAQTRASQINGCAYCCGVHAEAARKAGIEQAKLDKLPGWALSHLFDDREKLALEWCEALTVIGSDKPAIIKIREKLEKVFSEREVVDLTAAIAVINAFNRLVLPLENNH